MDDHSGFDPSEVFVYRGRGSVPKNVRRVEVDRSVKFIPDRLFEHCDQLESVLLHEGLLRIGEYAFDECSSLRGINIPRSVKFIPNFLFRCCRRLGFVLLHDEGLLGIGEHAFWGCRSLRVFRCPSTVTNIGEGAFWGCSNLAAVEFPPGLQFIEAWTFCACTSLEEVQIPASVARIGNSAFSGCTNLASLQLREGLRMIGALAFGGCILLESLQIPSSVDEIGVCAFKGCTTLASLGLREDLPKMKRWAFEGCTSLECFQFVRLSERMEVMRMDYQTKSMFESRLREITNALTRGPEDREAWEKCKKSLERAHEVLTYLELNGSMPVLDLALWKAKIEDEGEGRLWGGLADDEDGGQHARDAGRARRQGPQLSREDCRVKSGAGIVSAEVQKYFAYKTSWPRLDDLE